MRDKIITPNEIAIILNDIGENICEAESSIDSGRICYYITAQCTQMKILVQIDEDSELIQINGYPEPIQTKADQINYKTLKLLNIFNRDIKYGRWTVDEDGDFRVQFSIFLLDGKITRRTLAKINYIIRDIGFSQANMLRLQSIIDADISPDYECISTCIIRECIDDPYLFNKIKSTIKIGEGNIELLKLIYENLCHSSE